MQEQPLYPTRQDWPTAGWQTADPGAHGVDPAGLAAAQRHIEQHASHLDSLLVVRQGRLLHEWYGSTAGRDQLHSLKSVTKSVCSTLIGIAVQAGDLESVDERLVYILPEAFVTLSDRRKREITVRHLLGMRSGLEWVEYGPDFIQMTATPNWVEYVLERPLIHPPGTHHNYSTGDSHLLSAALTRLTGMPALDYADLYLFGPLGITGRRWAADPQGNNVGGSELQLTPRDMAKFGWLVLNQGRWEDRAVVSPDWLVQAHTPVTTFEPTPDQCVQLSYGWQWWLRPQGPHHSAIAVGYGGQFVTVVPALDLVVVITGRLSRVPEPFRDSSMLCQFNLVEDFIVPAVHD